MKLRQVSIMNVGCSGVGNGCCGFPVMLTNAMHQSADSNCMSIPVNQQLVQEPLLADSPALLPHHMPTPPPQNMVSALPFFNLMIPVADQFGGPVNTTVSPSVDPLGSDLPINGMSSAASHELLLLILCLNVC